MPRFSILPASALSVVILAGCADPPLGGAEPPVTACTLVGCEDLVTVNLIGLLAADAGATSLGIDACLDQDCLSATVVPGVGGTASCSVTPPDTTAECFSSSGGDVLIELPVPTQGAFVGAVHMVSATVRDAEGNVVLMDQASTTLVENQPNGPQCEPTCFQSGVDFSRH